MNLNLTKTTIILDKEKCLRNIAKVADKASSNELIFRPHFKTHQSRSVGRWFRDFKVDKITVSSVDMASYFAEDGWTDITIAIPVNLHEIEQINVLAYSIHLNLVVESPTVLKKLDQILRHEVGIFVKIDTGYHRTGIPFDDEARIVDIVYAFDGLHHCKLKGFLIHTGHTYKARSEAEILAIHQESIDNYSKVKDLIEPLRPGLEYSMGNTPACSVAEDFGIATELRPGNVVFYDLMQWQIDSCWLEEIGMVVACPVIAKHLDRRELVIHGGGVHFSKDKLYLDQVTYPVYGLAAAWDSKGWKIRPDFNYLASISQEHGIIKAGRDYFDEVEIGDFIPILPVHSCMAADLIRRYVTTEGEDILD